MYLGLHLYRSADSTIRSWRENNISELCFRFSQNRFASFWFRISQ